MIEPDTFYIRPEAADLLRQPEKTLADWAYRGVGPSYHRCGRRVLYLGSDLLSWLDSRRVEART